MALTIAIGSLALTLGVALSPQPAAAGGDLSGTWQASYQLACSAAFQQNGTQLEADVDCGLDLQGQLTGTIDPATRAVSLQGVVAALIDVTVDAELSADGSRLEGTFDAPPFVEGGGLSASRDVGDASDMTGDWDVLVDGIFSGECTAQVEHEGTQVTAQADCGEIESLAGSYDASTRALSLTASDVLNSALLIEATVTEDGDAFEGTWTLSVLDASGIITGSRLQGVPPLDDTGATATPEATQTPPAVLPSTGAGQSPAAAGPVWPALALVVAGAGGVAAALRLRQRA